MPIVSADKFTYFRPTAGVSNIKAQAFTPVIPATPDEVSKLTGAFQIKVGDELERMGKTIRAAQVRDDVQRFTLRALEDVSTAEAEEMQQGSHRDLPDRFQDRLKGIHAKYREEIGGDTDVLSAWGEKFGTLAQHHTERVRFSSWRRELDQQQASTIESEAATLGLVGKAQSMQEIRTITGDYIANGDAKARAGLVDASWWAGQKINFGRKVGSSLVEQDLLVEEAGAVPPGVAVRKLTSEQWESHYPGLTEDRRNLYLKHALDQTRQIKNQARIDEDREERAAEKAVKTAQENAYGDALVMHSQGRLTEPMIQNLISTRRIDPDKGKTLIDSVRGEARREDKGVNNPVVLGDLVTRLEMGADIGPDLDRAQARGEVKDETYIGLKKQLADKNFKRGSDYVSKALRPGEMDRNDQGKNLRYASAMEEYVSRVSAGEKPMEAADDVVLTALGKRRNAFAALPQPMFLEGDRNDLGNLNKAWVRTVEQFNAGNLAPEVYQREIRVLDELRRRKRDQDMMQAQAPKAAADLGARVKAVGGRPQ
jgi:hypothetical protein